MIARQLEIPTAAGGMGSFLCHPGDGQPHPAVIFLMDGPGIREELRQMACRLASGGYYVVLPNLYHREQTDELGDWFSGPQVRARIGELMSGLTMDDVQADIGSVLAFIDGDPAAADGPVGTLGYCMSGRYAIGAALRYPGRVVVAASIYGTKLVDPTPDSFHLQARASGAELYFAWAERDGYAPVKQAPVLARALSDAGVKATVEVYPGVDHGFAFKLFSTFDQDASDHHWERLFDLFGRNLGGEPAT